MNKNQKTVWELFSGFLWIPACYLPPYFMQRVISQKVSLYLDRTPQPDLYLPGVFCIGLGLCAVGLAGANYLIYQPFVFKARKNTHANHHFFKLLWLIIPLLSLPASWLRFAEKWLHPAGPSSLAAALLLGLGGMTMLAVELFPMIYYIDVFDYPTYSIRTPRVWSVLLIGAPALFLGSFVFFLMAVLTYYTAMQVYLFGVLAEAKHILVLGHWAILSFIIPFYMAEQNDWTLIWRFIRWNLAFIPGVGSEEELGGGLSGGGGASGTL